MMEMQQKRLEEFLINRKTIIANLKQTSAKASKH